MTEMTDEESRAMKMPDDGGLSLQGTDLPDLPDLRVDGRLPVRADLDQDWEGAIIVHDKSGNVGTVREVVVDGGAQAILFGTWADGEAFGVPAARVTRLDMHLVQRLYRQRNRLVAELGELRAKLRGLSDE